MRVRATHTGVLSFANVRAEPKSPPTVVESPPEAVSLRFDEQGKLRELTTGYPLDRRVGSTGGLGGLFGILEGVGYPLPTILTRPSGIVLAPLLRPFKLALPTAADDADRPRPTAPEAERLPEEQLLELAATLLGAQFGAADTSLLADGFEFCGPVVGPLDKPRFLGALDLMGIADGLPDLEYNYHDVAVCPYDVNRVWCSSAPPPTPHLRSRSGCCALHPERCHCAGTRLHRRARTRSRCRSLEPLTHRRAANGSRRQSAARSRLTAVAGASP
jgi:hypothetical protein